MVQGIEVRFVHDAGEDDRASEGLRPVFEQALRIGVQRARDTFDDDCADEAAVDHPPGLAEDDLKVGVLLVDGVQAGDDGAVVHEPLQGLAAPGEGEERHVGVPVIQELGDLLGGIEEGRHLVRGADVLHRANLETGNLIEDFFCHSLTFFGKNNHSFGKNMAEAIKMLFISYIQKYRL